MYRGGLTASADSASKTKTCPKCRRPLPFEAFDPNRARRDGRQCHCRKCRKEQRDTLRTGNGHANGNGHAKRNGSSRREDDQGEIEGGYTSTWKKQKISRKDLLLQRDKYLSIINAASLALERIEARLGINSGGDPVEEEPEEKEPENVQEDLAEDLEDDLG